MSELSDISIEKPAAEGSPTDHFMMQGKSGKTARVKNTLGNFLPFTIEAGTGDEIDIQEEGDDKEGVDNFGSQISFNRSTHEDELLSIWMVAPPISLVPSERLTRFRI